MNETKTNTLDAPEAGGTQAQINELQRQLTTLMVALLIASGTFCVYMWRQARLARLDLKNFKAAAVQNLSSFQKEKTRFDAFVGELAKYGKTHSDFAPIINKYKITAIEQPTGTNPPQAEQPAPAQSPQPKK